VHETSNDEKFKELHGDGHLGAHGNSMIVVIIIATRSIVAQFFMNILFKCHFFVQGLAKGFGEY